MKTLGFYVKGQKLSKKPSIIFSTLIAGSSNFYEASFEFSPEWKNLTKVVKFGYGNVEEYIPLIQTTCNIPERIMKLPTFYVSVIGVSDITQVSTNSVVVKQKGAN